MRGCVRNGCGHFVDAHQFERAFTVDAEPYAGGLGVDEGALTIARQAVDDALIELRDRGVRILGIGSGLVARERGEPAGELSPAAAAIRLSTRDALRIGIQAYLAALAAGDVAAADVLDALVVERPCQLYQPAGVHCNHWQTAAGSCCGCDAPRWVRGAAVLDVDADRSCTWRRPS